MPRLLFPFVLLLLVTCTKNIYINPETTEEGGRRATKVAYYIPQYAAPNEGPLKVERIAPQPMEETGKILYYQNYIFINKPQEGIHLIDNSDPSNPINEAFITLKGNIDLSIIDGYLYADQFSALVVIDIRDLNNIQFIESYTLSEIFNYDRYWAFEVIDQADAYEYVRFENIEDNKGIVVGWELEIRWENIPKNRFIFLDGFTQNYESAALAIEEVQSDTSIISQAGSLARFLPIGGFLYVLNQWELILFEIDTNYQPLRYGKTPLNNNAETLFQLNDLLFIGTTTGMLLYDVSRPTNPEFINSVDHFRSCDPVVADEKYAYVTLRGGTNCFTTRNELQIIALEDPENLEVISSQLLFNPHGLAIYQNYVLVCDGTAGMKVVDVSNREKPEVVNTYPIPFAYDVIIDYPSAIVVGEGKLYQYDISKLPQLELISN
ncbi:MAG: hypothetical protein P8O72_04040 [Flavobacteriaceae bacterium]|nr:hypothetical protein [Flavobacteriaceae bacterium]